MGWDFFIPGVKEKDLKIIQDKMEINTINELGKAAKARKIRQINGLNGKVELAILRGIKLLQEKPRFLPIGIAYNFSQIIIEKIKTWSQVNQVFLVGSLRRGKEEVEEIELLINGSQEIISDNLVYVPGIEGIIEKQVESIIFATSLGIPLKIYFSEDNNWGKDIILTTGSINHVNELKKNGQLTPLKSEEEIYKSLGLPYIFPELRETGYEVNIAKEGLLPNLIEEKDIKGDLHIHTQWSDGLATIEEVINKAIKSNYEYIAITDHSQALTVAGGLRVDDLHRQGKEIDALQAKYPQIKILKGIEVDILEDGTLDFPDNVLKTLDIVIASIHSHFKMTKLDMTQRIVKALEHPLVTILAHPTGRLLGKRPGYEVDIEKIINTAAQFNKALEINASPDRLDLRDAHLQLAKTKGVKIAINTDSHSLDDLDNIRYGVQTAQRGWQEKEDIINSWSYKKITEFLRRGL